MSKYCMHKVLLHSIYQANVYCFAIGLFDCFNFSSFTSVSAQFVARRGHAYVLMANKTILMLVNFLFAINLCKYSNCACAFVGWSFVHNSIRNSQMWLLIFHFLFIAFMFTLFMGIKCWTFYALAHRFIVETMAVHSMFNFLYNVQTFYGPFFYHPRRGFFFFHIWNGWNVHVFS